ncbi:MazG-like protein [Dyadobacter psychrotolerans]|uniref:MazG-like protein n=1 Tax=Dyadobacter psychrotolerans TaxID=2541721 RepID=A0A4V2Z4C1_9BACT|nr:MazG-like protein [Dyadobacter psychrotolerans]TDE15568.1 MazG-like protein [Dyadobacter psychrotolerans]
MKDLDLKQIKERSVKIRQSYHKLEKQHHGSEWTVEEDALAFLTDAGLVGRLAMSQQGRWPKGAQTVPELEHKLGECIWWLTILAERMGLDINDVTEKFLTKTEKLLE